MIVTELVYSSILILGLELKSLLICLLLTMWKIFKLTLILASDPVFIKVNLILGLALFPFLILSL